VAVTGILGGTFDPPHNGHVALARAAIEHFGLERLEVRVVADPGHKRAAASAETRLELARLAFASLQSTLLGANVELEPHGYTVDALEAAPPEDAVFLIGADEFAAFLSWKRPQRVLELARLGVATRPGYPQEQLDGVLAQLERPERVELFELEPQPVSSTEIRERVRRGEPIDHLVPPAVAERIDGLGVYRRPTGG
jgi:nicotinate-nucleotide adenylyltransferase